MSTHRTHRRRRTTQCTGPGSRPEAWRSPHQRRTLNGTEDERWAPDPAGLVSHWVYCMFTSGHDSMHEAKRHPLAALQKKQKTNHVGLQYHRRRWLPGDFSPAAEPIYSRFRGRRGRSLPAATQWCSSLSKQLRNLYFLAALISFKTSNFFKI